MILFCEHSTGTFRRFNWLVGLAISQDQLRTVFKK